MAANARSHVPIIRIVSADLYSAGGGVCEAGKFRFGRFNQGFKPSSYHSGQITQPLRLVKGIARRLGAKQMSTRELQSIAIGIPESAVYQLLVRVSIRCVFIHKLPPKVSAVRVRFCRTITLVVCSEILPLDDENSQPLARVCHLVGPGGLPETGSGLFRPCGLRATGARCQMLQGSHLFEPPVRTSS